MSGFPTEERHLETLPLALSRPDGRLRLNPTWLLTTPYQHPSHIYMYVEPGRQAIGVVEAMEERQMRLYLMSVASDFTKALISSNMGYGHSEPQAVSLETRIPSPHDLSLDDIDMVDYPARTKRDGIFSAHEARLARVSYSLERTISLDAIQSIYEGLVQRVPRYHELN